MIIWCSSGTLVVSRQMRMPVYRIRSPNETRQDAADMANLINYNRDQKKQYTHGKKTHHLSAVCIVSKWLWTCMHLGCSFVLRFSCVCRDDEAQWSLWPETGSTVSSVHITESIYIFRRVVLEYLQDSSICHVFQMRFTYGIKTWKLLNIKRAMNKLPWNSTIPEKSYRC